ncbi:MAG: hypothetical protein ACRDN0_39195 [Trebonia sp.]
MTPPKAPKTTVQPPEADTPTTPEPTVLGRSQTTVERSQWEIDGKIYDIRSMDDFGVRAQRRLNQDGREFYQLWNSAEDLTDDQDMRLEQLLDRMFFGDEKAPSLIDAPKTLLRKLGSSARADVVLTFTLAPLQKLLLAAAQTEVEMESAGVSEPVTAT